MRTQAYIFVISGQKNVDNSAFSDIDTPFITDGYCSDSYCCNKIPDPSCNVFEVPAYATTLLTKQGEEWKYFFTCQIPPIVFVSFFCCDPVRMALLLLMQLKKGNRVKKEAGTSWMKIRNPFSMKLEETRDVGECLK